MVTKDEFLEFHNTFYNKRKEIEWPEKTIKLDEYEWLQNSTERKIFFANLIINEAVRTIGGEINSFYQDIKSCKAWSVINSSLTKEKKLYLTNIIALNDIKAMLLAPYEIKQRFIFFSTNALHLVRLKTDIYWGECCFPEEHGISMKTLDLFKNWKGPDIKNFKNKLCKIESAEIRKETKDYRRKLQHRIPIHIDIGISGILERVKLKDKVTYNICENKALNFEKIIASSLKQHEVMLETYDAMLHLFDELLEILPREAPIKTINRQE
jgi:hypothetical protein